MRSRPAPLIPTEPPIPPTSFAQVGSKLHKLLRGPGLRPSQVVEKPHLRLPRASVENFRLITPEEAVDEGEPRVSREACPLLAALREVLKPQGARLWCPRRLRLVSCQVWSAGPKARRCPRKTKLRLRRRHEHVRYTLNACSSCSARALHFEQRPLSTAVTAQERMEPTRWLIEPHGRVRLLVKFFSEARVGPGRCLKLGTAVCDMLRHVATCCDMLRHVATCCDMLRHVATCCDMLRHVATLLFFLVRRLAPIKHLWALKWLEASPCPEAKMERCVARAARQASMATRPCPSRCLALPLSQALPLSGQSPGIPNSPARHQQRPAERFHAPREDQACKRICEQAVHCFHRQPALASACNRGVLAFAWRIGLRIEQASSTLGHFSWAAVQMQGKKKGSMVA